jgi:hypothetical protein
MLTAMILAVGGSMISVLELAGLLATGCRILSNLDTVTRVMRAFIIRGGCAACR